MYNPVGDVSGARRGIHTTIRLCVAPQIQTSLLKLSKVLNWQGLRSGLFLN